MMHPTSSGNHEKEPIALSKRSCLERQTASATLNDVSIGVARPVGEFYFSMRPEVAPRTEIIDTFLSDEHLSALRRRTRNLQLQIYRIKLGLLLLKLRLKITNLVRQILRFVICCFQNASKNAGHEIPPLDNQTIH